MGRTSNTRQRIDKYRAHVHFELNLLVNPNFPAWYKRNFPNQRNDHGVFNGLNLTGLDPQDLFWAEYKQGTNFNLLRYIQAQQELCRVWVRKAHFPWLQRYRSLVVPNPRAEKEGVVGYEISLNFNSLPFRLIPRSASETSHLKNLQVLAVNEPELKENPCRKLVRQNGNSWELAPQGREYLELLTY
jgi:hypothetical protein